MQGGTMWHIRESSRIALATKARKSKGQSQFVLTLYSCQSQGKTRAQSIPAYHLSPVTCEAPWPFFGPNITTFGEFSKTGALFLQHHCPYNCSISLLLGALLSSSHLCNLSKPEVEAIEKHNDDSLMAGIIHLSSSPVRAKFFFVDKKDGSLHPYTDTEYHSLNKIITKHKYPFPPLSSALNPSLEQQSSLSWTYLFIVLFIAFSKLPSANPLTYLPACHLLPWHPIRYCSLSFECPFARL